MIAAINAVDLDKNLNNDAARPRISSDMGALGKIAALNPAPNTLKLCVAVKIPTNGNKIINNDTKSIKLNMSPLRSIIVAPVKNKKIA